MFIKLKAILPMCVLSFGFIISGCDMNQDGMGKAVTLSGNYLDAGYTLKNYAVAGQGSLQLSANKAIFRCPISYVPAPNAQETSFNTRLNMTCNRQGGCIIAQMILNKPDTYKSVINGSVAQSRYLTLTSNDNDNVLSLTCVPEDQLNDWIE